MLKETSADSAPPERRGFLLSEIPSRERTCRRCGFEGAETLFKFAGKRGSRGNICRKCDAERLRKRQAEHGAEINERRRERRALDPERIRVRERANRMKRIERVRAQNAEAVKRYRQRHPEKVTAQKIAQHALKRGEIKKPACCEVLGCKCCDIEMHHFDYRKPKDVIFLCNARGANHHEAVHHFKPLRLKSGAIRKFARAPRAPRAAA